MLTSWTRVLQDVIEVSNASAILGSLRATAALIGYTTPEAKGLREAGFGRWISLFVLKD